MAGPTLLDVRQTVYRNILSQIYPNVSGATLDVLLQSINLDLTDPLSVTATSTASLVVNVGPSVVTNTVSNRSKSLAFVNDVIPSLTSGTITFPSSSGGNITTSTGQSAVLTLPSGNYAQVLLSIDSNNNLQVQVGSAASTAATAVVPFPLTNYLPYAYVTLFNNSGTIANVTQSTIFQLNAGIPTPAASGGGSGVNWVAKEAALSSGTTTFSAVFTTAQTDTGFVVFAIMENLVDANPMIQQLEVTAKSVNGFSVAWNMPLDSNNYKISYVVPPRYFPMAEVAIASSTSPASPTLAVGQTGTGYPALAMLQNLTDANPKFQPVTVSNASASAITLNYADPTDTANYQAVYDITATVQKTLASGITSQVIALPVAYGSTGYAVMVTLMDSADTNPKSQPLIITAKSTTSFTVSWSDPTDTTNYVLNAYVLSSTT